MMASLSVGFVLCITQNFSTYVPAGEAMFADTAYIVAKNVLFACILI